MRYPNKPVQEREKGLPYQQTSYSDGAATTVVNQVQDVYNGYGQLLTQYQEHGGPVSPAFLMRVQYAYSQPSGANYSRLTSMTYPNGRVLDYVYNSGLDSDISRVSGLSDDAGTGAGSVESYKYLGSGTIIQRLDGNGIELTYIKQSGESNGDAGDQYIGLDRFGRVADQRWIPVSSPTTPTDRFQYGYDRDGNVLYKNNLVNSTFSELYHNNSATSGDNNTAYDNLNRITGFRRGTLASSGHNGSGLDTVTTLNSNPNSSQSWTLDAVGNQTAVNTDGTNKTNTLNSQNELTGFGTATLAFDNNGNTTTDDQGHTLIYNAWNELVQVKNGGTALASYVYDANGNRVQQTDGGTTSDLYNSTAGQVLEERQSGTTTNQYVWSIAYVNTPVRDDNSTSGSYGLNGSGLGRRLYPQEDANQNVTALTNTTGVVQQRFDYTPYGIMTVLDGTTNWGTSTNLYSWVDTFQGGRYDPATGMVHFGEREYDPLTSRWMQQEPFGGLYVDGANLFQMDRGNPIGFVDPLGTDAGWARYNPTPYDPYLEGPGSSPGRGSGAVAAIPNLPNPNSPNWGPIDPVTGQPNYLPKIPGGWKGAEPK
jgi:RHS repeat-associated protein